MKLKDSWKLVLLVVLASLGSLLIYYNTQVKNSVTSDEKKFKEEYEALNGTTNSANKKYLDVKILENNNIVYTNYEEIFNIFENKESAIIYFGFPECPWCRNAVPVLLDAANDYGIDKILYLNNKVDRDIKHLDEFNNIITDNEGSADYNKLVSIISDSLTPYNGLNDDSIKRLYFPTVLFIKDGKVNGIHISTVDTQIDPYIALTDAQKEELMKVYTDYFRETFKDSCDESC